MKVFFGLKPRAIRSSILSCEYSRDSSNVSFSFTKNFSSSEIGI